MISIGKQLGKVGIDKIWLLAVLILKFNRIAKRASLGGKEEVTLHQFQVFLSIGFPTYKHFFPTYKHFFPHIQTFTKRRQEKHWRYVPHSIRLFHVLQYTTYNTLARVDLQVFTLSHLRCCLWSRSQKKRCSLIFQIF